MPRARSNVDEEEHDDSRRDVVGGGALQQRSVPDEGLELRRKLRQERPDSGPPDQAGADDRGDQEERRPAVPDADPAVGDYAARQRAARLRAWRRREAPP